MAGILNTDPVGILDPRSAALMQMGLSLLGQGPSRTPVSFGQSLGQAGMQGMNAYAQANQANQQQQLFAMKMAEAQRLDEERKQRQGYLQQVAATLPESERVMFMADPATFLKHRMDSPFAKINPADYTQESVAQFTQTKNPAVLVPVRKKDIAPSGEVVDLYSAKPGTVLPDPNKPFSTGPNGPVPNTPYQEYEARKAAAGATRVQTNVNAFTPASEAAQRDFMAKTSANYEALRTAPVMLANIEKAKELASDKNPFIGSFGSQKAAVAQFFNNNLGTSIAPDQIADAGELKNRLFQQIMENLKKMDAQPSQLQQQLMMDALGNINSDPKALKKIMTVTDEVIRGKVDLHNREVKSAEDKGVKFPYNPTIDLPAPKEAGPKAPPPPKRGQVVDGWEFIGGDPANRMNWRKK